MKILKLFKVSMNTIPRFMRHTNYEIIIYICMRKPEIVTIVRTFASYNLTNRRNFVSPKFTEIESPWSDRLNALTRWPSNDGKVSGFLDVVTVEQNSLRIWCIILTISALPARHLHSIARLFRSVKLNVRIAATKFT